MDLNSFVNFIDSIDYDKTNTEDIINKLIECKYIYQNMYLYKKFYENLFYLDKTNELNKLKYIIVLCLWSKHYQNIDILNKYINKYKNNLFDNLLNEKINNLTL